jgi:hypothetical protein
VTRETADSLRRLGAPKTVRTRLSELPPGKALGSRLVNGERVWRVVPATQSQPTASPELEAARRRARRAVTRARRDRRRMLLAHMDRAMRIHRARA